MHKSACPTVTCGGEFKHSASSDSMVSSKQSQTIVLLLLLLATVKEPAVSNMCKGITMAYALITSTYFSVAISGYWAFGQNVYPTC